VIIVGYDVELATDVFLLAKSRIGDP